MRPRNGSNLGLCTVILERDGAEYWVRLHYAYDRRTKEARISRAWDEEAKADFELTPAEERVLARHCAREAQS
jgi:hypothetical protein